MKLRDHNRSAVGHVGSSRSATSQRFQDQIGFDSGLDHRPSSCNELDHQYDQRKHQQKMNKPAQRVATYEAEQPHHQEDYEDRPEHI